MPGTVGTIIQPQRIVLSKARKRQAAVLAGIAFLTLGSLAYFGEFSPETPTIHSDARAVGIHAAAQPRFKSEPEETPIPPDLGISAPEDSADARQSDAQITEAKKRAETLFYEWEKANTKNLTFLNEKWANQGTNSSFILPKLETATLNEIAERSGVGPGEDVREEVVQHVRRTARRPLQKFRYLHLKLGESAPLDEITYMDLDDEKSFTVDPISGDVKILKYGSIVFDRLKDADKRRYQHIFEIAE